MYRQALLTAVRVLVVPMAAVQAAVMALAVVRMAALVVVLAAAMAAAPVAAPVVVLAAVLAVTTVAALEQVPRLWSQVRSLGKWAQWSVVSAPRSAVLATH